MEKESSKIWWGIYIGAFVLFLLFLIGYVYYVHNEAIKDIKQKLKNAVEMTYAIVGNNFLENELTDPNKNSNELIWQKLSQITKYAFIHEIKGGLGIGGKKNNQRYLLLMALQSEYNLKHHIRKVGSDDAYDFNVTQYTPKLSKKWGKLTQKAINEGYETWIDGITGQKCIYYFKMYKLLKLDNRICIYAEMLTKDIEIKTSSAILKSLFLFLFFAFSTIPIVTVLQFKLRRENKQLFKAKKEETIAKLISEEARKKVEQANKSKDQFFANMSHDFRTPLNAIMGFSKQIHSNKFDNQQLSKYINLSANYMLNFTEDLLDFTKIENDNLEYVEEIVNLEEVILMVNECYALRAYEEGKKFRLDLANNLPLSIESSKRRLFQVMNNLVSNSMKFIKKGQEVKLKVFVNKENKLEIIVQDNGIGIKKENIDKIFEKFYKANTKNNGSGVGLGLFITKTITENMNGTIRVESEVNKFAKFTVILPLKEISKELNFENMYAKYLERNNFKSEARKNKNLKEFIDETCEYLEMLKNSVTNDDLQSVGAYSHKIAGMADNAMLFELEYYSQKIEREALKQDKDRGRIDKYCKILEEGINKLPYPKKVIGESQKELKIKKILIVDDTLYNAKILHETLYDLGFGSDFVLSGKEALEMIDEKEYKVIFIDINMPEMDGKQLFERLKQKKIKAKLIAFTADKTDKTKNSLLKLGFDEIFDKRISEGQLTRILDNYL